MWVGEKTLPAVTNLPIGEASNYFGELTLTGRRGEIAAKILKEICERLQFWSTSVSTTSPSTAVPIPCPVAKRSVSAWPARSALAWWG